MEIKREIYTKIKQHAENQEITLIIGPRQAGKTTIAKKLQAELLSEGKRTIFFNLDIETDYSIMESQEKLLFALRNQTGEEKAYVFIDEFQRKVDGGKFLKGLYDMNLPYKFIITGSGSIELKEQVHESLAGRKRTFEVTPLTFNEYLNYKTNYEFEDRLEKFAQIYKDRFHFHLMNYLTFGGYPKLALAEEIIEKRLILQEIYNSYLIKDVAALLKIEKTDAFQKLIQNLSVLNGKLINISQLSASAGISSQTLEKYLWYLEKTYIITKCRPFSKNPLKEINRSYTLYFNDLGLKNLISGDFIEPSLRNDLGFDFQNLIFLSLNNTLQEKQPISINFWRSKDSAEVDFILKRGKNIVPMECKFSELKSEKVSKSFRSFINKYQPQIGFVVNRSFESSLMVENTEVFFLPYFKFELLKDYI